MWSNAEMDWDNEQICHWLTAVGLGEYVQVFRGQTRHHRKGIVCFLRFRFSFWWGKEGVLNGSKQRLRTVLQIWSLCFKFNFYFLGGGHFKYLYLCGGTPKIIKILVVVPQIIDGVPTPPQVFFPGKALSRNEINIKNKNYVPVPRQDLDFQHHMLWPF
jgi:hypothetical protein